MCIRDRYYGEDIKEAEAEGLQKALEEAYPDCDVELQYGGQPIYYYVISVSYTHLDVYKRQIMDRATVWLILQRVLPNPAIPLLPISASSFPSLICRRPADSFY